jgi:hypothetical protein
MPHLACSALVRSIPLGVWNFLGIPAVDRRERQKFEGPRSQHSNYEPAAPRSPHSPKSQNDDIVRYVSLR